MFHIFGPDAAVVYSWLLYLILNDLITKPDHQLSQLKTFVELELNVLSFISISIFYFHILFSVSFVCAQRAYSSKTHFFQVKHIFILFFIV